MREYAKKVKFNILMHKKNAEGPLSLVIYENGDIESAVPNQEQFLIKKAQERLRCSKGELLKDIAMFSNVLGRLCTINNCIAVFSNFYVCGARVSKRQKAKLRVLKIYGIYRGKI